MQRWLKLGIAGSCLFVFGVAFGFFIFPLLLKSQVKAQVTLRPGAEMRQLWEAPPFPLDFRVFLFNITNPDEIEAGAKPIVNEVGPFFYHEYKEKVNLKDVEKDDTCEYSNKVTWHFSPEKTGLGLSEDTVLTFPHVMILSMIMTVMREQPGTISFARRAVDSIFHKPESIFIRATVKQILWTGLNVDCTVQDFQGKSACVLLAEKEESFIKDGPGKYRFALLGAKNGTVSSERIKVKRGLQNYRQVGEMAEFKGQKIQEIWGEEGSCNNLTGTDSTIFHPLLFEDEDMVSFSPDLCITLPAHYVKSSNVKGVPTNHYEADYGDMSTDENLKCLCPAPNKCLKKGVVDLFPCVGVPMVASLPHFYRTDDSYLAQVDGLHPDKEEHQIIIHLEPLTGSPVEARKRLQFSMFIRPLEKFPLMKTFPQALLPLFWVEEGVLLEDKYTDQLKAAYTLIFIVSIVQWVTIIGGLVLIATAVWLRYRGNERSKKIDITTISPQFTSTALNSMENKRSPDVTTHNASVERN